MTKQAKVNVQRRKNGKKRLLFLIFIDICLIFLSLTTNNQYFVNKLYKVGISTNDVSKF